MQTKSFPENAWQLLWYGLQFKNYKWFALLCFLSDLLIIIAKLSLTFLIGMLINVAQSTEQITWDHLTQLITFLLLAGTLAIIAVFINSEALKKLTIPYQATLTDDIYRRIRNKHFTFFINSYTGQIAQKIAEIPLNSFLALDNIIHRVLRVKLYVIVGTLFLLSQDLLIGFVSTLWMLIFFTFCLVTGLKCGQLSKDQSNQRSLLSANMVDVISNISSVRLFAAHEIETKRFDKLLRLFQKIGQKLFNYQKNMLTLSTFLTISFLITVTFLILLKLINSHIVLSEAATLLAILMIIYNNVENLPYNIRLMMSDMGSVTDGIQVLDLNNEHDYPKQTNKLAVKHGAITLDKMGFAYKDGAKPVFEQLDLTIQPGQKVGLLGHSGAGKSTLLSLLLGFHQAQQGKILIDQQDITKVDIDTLRENIAVIPQDTMLFHRSIQDNIAYGQPNADRAAVIAAAKLAHADEFITELPQQYDTLVGERGVKLSGGQRQRIAIARAILKNAPILILDEATSALDSESEQLIQASLADLMADKTVIAIAHRLSTIRHLDRLIVLEYGKVVEDGTHDELLKQGGHYAKLWSMQSHGFIG